MPRRRKDFREEVDHLKVETPCACVRVQKTSAREDELRWGLGTSGLRGADGWVCGVNRKKIGNLEAKTPEGLCSFLRNEEIREFL